MQVIPFLGQRITTKKSVSKAKTQASIKSSDKKKVNKDDQKKKTGTGNGNQQDADCIIMPPPRKTVGRKMTKGRKSSAVYSGGKAQILVSPQAGSMCTSVPSDAKRRLVFSGNEPNKTVKIFVTPRHDTPKEMTVAKKSGETKNVRKIGVLNKCSFQEVCKLSKEENKKVTKMFMSSNSNIQPLSPGLPKSPRSKFLFCHELLSGDEDEVSMKQQLEQMHYHSEQSFTGEGEERSAMGGAIPDEVAGLFADRSQYDEYLRAERSYLQECSHTSQPATDAQRTCLQVYVDNEHDIFSNLKLLAEVASICSRLEELSRCCDQNFSDQPKPSLLRAMAATEAGGYGSAVSTGYEDSNSLPDISIGTVYIDQSHPTLMFW